MAHLTDMEELLSSIPAADIRDYMRESMSCYMAGAYRGSIVLSYIALFDDVLAKLGELANVNKKAKAIFAEASKKKSDQEVFESYLIDQLTASNLLPELDAAFLKTLRSLRNKSAHPSGHTPSPEEARFVFYETIARFLSRPILSTTHLVDEIIGRLKNTHFFPSPAVPDLVGIVTEETASLHEEAIPQLVAKLVTSATASDNNIQKNAAKFIIGLAAEGKGDALKALQKSLVSAKGDDPQYSDLILTVLSTNGTLALGLSTAALGRVKAILSQKIDSLRGTLSEAKLLHPLSTLASIAKALPQVDFISRFSPEVSLLAEKRPQSAGLIKLVAEKPFLLELYFPVLLENAGSSDFATANAIASAMELVDENLYRLLSDEQAFALVVAMLKAADHGAFTPKAISDSKFAGVPQLRAKAKRYVAENDKVAETYLGKKLSFVGPIADFNATYLEDEA